MRNIFLLPIFALICALPTAAQARIGESVEQCIARYGQPTDTLANGKRLKFEKGAFTIFVEFLDGTAQSLIFVKKPLGTPIDESERLALMLVNGGDKWVSVERTERSDKRITESNSMAALYSTDTKTFTIITANYLERLTPSAVPGF